MKVKSSLIICLTTFTLAALAQQPLPPKPARPPGAAPDEYTERINQIVARATEGAATAPTLTKFNLDFPCGTPNELVAAIQKATGKPFNAIIQDEDANTKLPPIKVNNVDVAQLFQTLLEGSYKYSSTSRGDREVISSYGFQTIGGRSTDDSIWTFFAYNKPLTPASALTKFNLDFPGGAPKELVAAIQKATGKPLNAIIPDEHANIKLPPLKMTGVDVPQLFQALQLASAKVIAYVTGNSFGGFGGGGGQNQSYQQMNTSYGFRTSGTPTDDSIWYFYADKPNLPTLEPVKTSRFYALTPYLDRGLTVDDITTAIQAGWKMLGDKETPTISFHKETKLLIAVGEPDKLRVIDDVLKALEPASPPLRSGGLGGGRSGPVMITPPAEEPKTNQ